MVLSGENVRKTFSFNFGASRLLEVFKKYYLQDALYTNTFYRKRTNPESRKVVGKKVIREKKGRVLYGPGRGKIFRVYGPFWGKFYFWA